MCRRVPAAEATSKMGEVVFLAQRQPNPRHLRASFMPDTLGLSPKRDPLEVIVRCGPAAR
jgi:hypothetical protein